MGIILSFIATILYILLYIVDFIRVLIVNIKRSAYIKKVDKERFTTALQADVFGNYQYKDLFNWMFCKKGKVLFGVFGETISSALGKGRRDEKLNGFGFAFSYLLDIIWVTDWLKGGHCKASIMSDIEIEINEHKILKTNYAR